MKKLFTLTIMALLLAVGSISAQRKTWDFTKGFSSATIESLKAAGWTDETAGRAIQSGERSGKQQLAYTINGVEWVVPETEGLIFGQTAAKHIVFAYDYNNTGFKGSKFLWLNGNRAAQDYVIVPAVPAGEKVTIVYESHSTTQARGFKTEGNFKDENDNQTFTSMGDTMRVVIYNKGNDEADMKLTNTNGYHIYSIVIGDGDPVETTEVAYLYNSEADGILTKLQARELTTVTAIDVATTAVTAAGLQAYDLVVVSANIPAENAAVSAVKEAMPFVPTLNLNPNLYAAWGYGETVALDQPIAVVKTASHALVKGVELMDNEGTKFFQLSDMGAPLYAVNLGEYFAGDATPIVSFTDPEDTEAVASPVAHLHNIDHNGYVYLPYAADATAELLQVIGNATELLIESKQQVGKAPMPGISLEYKNLNTNITLIPSNILVKPHVYYTLDGTTPTTESTEYTGPINVTEACTVKAVAIGEGYLLSDPNSMTVDLKEQPKTPVITSNYQEGQTLVTITTATKGDDIKVYYNFTGSTNVSESTEFTDSVIVVTRPEDYYAFAVAANSVWSEVAHERIVVKDVHIAADIISHFKTGDWYIDGTKVANNGSLFTDNMNTATSMYDKTGEGQVSVDEGTGDEIETYPEVAWLTSDETVGEGETAQWMAATKGEVILWQSNAPAYSNFGDDGGVNPVLVSDVDTIFPATKYNLQFYTPYSGEPTNATIQSKVKWAGPFDVVVISCMPGGEASVQVSADGETWTTLGEPIAKTGMSRAYKTDYRSYTGTEEVYVRVARTDNDGAVKSGPKIYDIYVANAGELTATLKAQFDAEYAAVSTGIETIDPQPRRALQGIYNINGVRQNGLQRGLNIVVQGDGTVRKVLVK